MVDVDLSKYPEHVQDRIKYLIENTTLSDRQAEVQALGEEGKVRRQIADSIGISVRTVDRHRENIKEKIELSRATYEELDT